MMQLVRQFLGLAGPHDKRAKLPLELRETRISDLAVGEAGYTVPWAITTDPEANLWLNPSYTVKARPGGTVQLLVSRHADGYHANVLSMKFADREYKWDRSATPHGWIPVVEIW